MKCLSPIALIFVSSFSMSALAKISCTTDTNTIDSVEVLQDGGEETLAVHLPNEKVERYLVMENDYQGRIVAVIDADLNRHANSRGVILLINQKTNKANLAYKGQVIAMECK